VVQRVGHLACDPKGGMQHFEGDGPVVLHVMGEIDGRHAAPAELAVDHVSVAQDIGQRWVAHWQGYLWHGVLANLLVAEVRRQV